MRLCVSARDDEAALFHETLMKITLNGERKEVPAGLTVDGLLRHLSIEPGRVAVELNLHIVRKAAYAETAVNEGDSVEVVQFMGGG